MNWHEEQELQKKIRGGWTAVVVGSAFAVIPFLFPITVIAACIGIGKGIGAMTWPGYSGKGIKLIAASILGPLMVWAGLFLFWYLAIRD